MINVGSSLLPWKIKKTKFSLRRTPRYWLVILLLNQLKSDRIYDFFDWILNQMEFRLVTSQSKNCKYNLISVDLSIFKSRYLCTWYIHVYCIHVYYETFQLVISNLWVQKWRPSHSTFLLLLTADNTSTRKSVKTDIVLYFIYYL